LQGQVKQILGIAFSVVDEIDVSNLETLTISEDESSAVVEVTSDWQIQILGQTNEGRFNESVDLEKEDGEWLINDFSPFESLFAVGSQVKED
jgi:hypothetical protein